MKRSILLLSILLLCGTAAAQQPDLYGAPFDSRPQAKTESYRHYRALGVKPPYAQQHEFRIGYGILATTGDGESIGMRTSPNADPGNEYRNIWWRYDRMGYDVRHGMNGWRCTETVSIGYLYHINRMVHAGATIAYFGASERSATDRVRYKFDSWALTAKLRFAWLSRTVKIYSEIGIGMGIGRFSRAKADILHSHQWVLDITGFGISAGNRLFWYGEIGWGANGVLRTGIGFRFATCKAKARAEAETARQIAERAVAH